MATMRVCTSSPPLGPRMAAPRMRSVSPSTTTFIIPWVWLLSMARATQPMGMEPTFTLWPAARAAFSVMPTRPSSGSVKRV